MIIINKLVVEYLFTKHLEHKAQGFFVTLYKGHKLGVFKVFTTEYWIERVKNTVYITIVILVQRLALIIIKNVNSLYHLRYRFTQYLYLCAEWEFTT